MAKSLLFALLLASQSCARVASYTGPQSYSQAPSGYQAPPGYQPPVQQPRAQVPPSYAPPRNQPPATQLPRPLLAPQAAVQALSRDPPPGTQLPVQPLPNYGQSEDSGEPLDRAGIVKQKDLFLKQSKDNVDAELQRVFETREAVRNAFLEVIEKNRQDYLEHLEHIARQQLLDLDEQAALKTREVEATGEDYASRLEQRTKTLLVEVSHQQLRRAHKELIARIGKEEGWARDELEHQIRAAYDAAKIPSGAFPDPNPAIQQARNRFDLQMQDLAAKRSGLENDLKQQMQAVEAGDILL